MKDHDFNFDGIERNIKFQNLKTNQREVKIEQKEFKENAITWNNGQLLVRTIKTML